MSLNLLESCSSVLSVVKMFVIGGSLVVVHISQQPCARLEDCVENKIWVMTMM